MWLCMRDASTYRLAGCPYLDHIYLPTGASATPHPFKRSRNVNTIIKRTGNTGRAITPDRKRVWFQGLCGLMLCESCPLGVTLTSERCISWRRHLLCQSPYSWRFLRRSISLVVCRSSKYTTGHPTMLAKSSRPISTNPNVFMAGGLEWKVVVYIIGEPGGAVDIVVGLRSLVLRAGLGVVRPVARITFWLLGDFTGMLIDLLRPGLGDGI